MKQDATQFELAKFPLPSPDRQNHNRREAKATPSGLSTTAPNIRPSSVTAVQPTLIEHRIVAARTAVSRRFHSTAFIDIHFLMPYPRH